MAMGSYRLNGYGHGGFLAKLRCWLKGRHYFNLDGECRVCRQPFVFDE